MIRKFFLVAAFCALPSLASAQEAKQFYVEAGAQALRIEDSGVWAEPGTASLTFGMILNEYFAVEVMAATGIYSANAGTDVSISSVFGAYVKPSFEVVPRLSVFGKLGVTNGTVSAAGLRNSDTGFSYGAGLQFDLTDSLYAGLSYMSYYSKYGTTYRGAGLALGVMF
jgi:outer membrane immunogenic protein